MNYRWKEYFGWSSSRVNMWQQCRGRYRHNYIDSYQLKYGSAEWVELKRLKDLTTVSMYLGSVVHAAVASVLLDVKSGKPLNIQSAHEIVEKSFKQAMTRPKFTELENGILDSTILLERLNHAQDNAIAMVNLFYHDILPNYKAHTLLEIDGDPTRFLADGVHMWVNVDLLSKDPNGRLMITDWKTGKDVFDPEETSNDQLHAYAIWAALRYNVPPDDILTGLVSLRTGERKDFHRTKEEIESFKAKVKEESKSMLMVSDHTAFPTTPGKECRYCNYLKKCSDGRMFITPASIG
jgi:hypothetical protein